MFPLFLPVRCGAQKGSGVPKVPRSKCRHLDRRVQKQSVILHRLSLICVSDVVVLL